MRSHNITYVQKKLEKLINQVCDTKKPIRIRTEKGAVIMLCKEQYETAKNFNSRESR